jgi:hypothetical protein
LTFQLLGVLCLTDAASGSCEVGKRSVHLPSPGDDTPLPRFSFACTVGLAERKYQLIADSSNCGIAIVTITELCGFSASSSQAR